MFSREFCQIFKSIFFMELLRWMLERDFWIETTFLYKICKGDKISTGISVYSVFNTHD